MITRDMRDGKNLGRFLRFMGRVIKLRFVYKPLSNVCCCLCFCYLRNKNGKRSRFRSHHSLHNFDDTP